MLRSDPRFLVLKLSLVLVSVCAAASSVLSTPQAQQAAAQSAENKSEAAPPLRATTARHRASRPGQCHRQRQTRQSHNRPFTKGFHYSRQGQPTRNSRFRSPDEPPIGPFSNYASSARHLHKSSRGTNQHTCQHHYHSLGRTQHGTRRPGARPEASHSGAAAYSTAGIRCPLLAWRRPTTSPARFLTTRRLRPSPSPRWLR